MKTDDLLKRTSVFQVLHATLVIRFVSQTSLFVMSCCVGLCCVCGWGEKPSMCGVVPRLVVVVFVRLMVSKYDGGGGVDDDGVDGSDG